MDPPALPVLALKGVVLGWSVAWIPGPINTEILRRGLRDGARAGFMVGLGATSADFLWALAVCAGVSAAATAPGVERVLAAASALLLLLLAAHFLRSAYRAVRRARTEAAPAPTTPSPPPDAAAPASAAAPRPSDRRGAMVGFAMAALSPFNVAFWLGFMGQDAARGVRGFGMLVLATGVVVGALAWCTVLCAALRLGARTPSARWEAFTEGLAAALMLGFGIRMALSPVLWAD